MMTPTRRTFLGALMVGVSLAFPRFRLGVVDEPGTAASGTWKPDYSTERYFLITEVEVYNGTRIVAANDGEEEITVRMPSDQFFPFGVGHILQVTHT